MPNAISRLWKEAQVASCSSGFCSPCPEASLGNQEMRRDHAEAEPSQVHRGSRTSMVQRHLRISRGFFKLFKTDVRVVYICRTYVHTYSDMHALDMENAVVAKILELKRIYPRDHTVRLTRPYVIRLRSHGKLMTTSRTQGS